MSHSKSETCSVNDPNHSFSISLATALKSSDQAIFLHHVGYWLKYNERLKQNFHEGRYWTYDTLERLHAHFPYWTQKQLRLIIEKLVQMGILIKGNFNKDKYDRTVWYTIDYEKVKCICPKGQIDLPDQANGIDQKGRPIPHNKPHNKPIKKENIEKKEETPLEQKIVFKEKVQLTQAEYDKLLALHGTEKLDLMLEKLDSHIIAKGDKYASHYGVLKKGGWVIQAVEKEKSEEPSSKKDKTLYEKCIQFQKEYESNVCDINITSEGIFFIPTVGQSQPYMIKFSDNGAKDRILNEFRKKEFKKKKEPM